MNYIIIFLKKSVIEGTYIGLDIMRKSKGGDGGVIVNTASIGGK